MLNLNNIYTQKQIDILKACQNTDWFMLINHRSVISNVFETFVCYGLDVERTPLFAVRYPKYKIGQEERVSITVYTDTETITYKPTTVNILNLEEESRERHYWGEVPITEYSPDRYRQGGYEDVTSLIDLYDAAESDSANYMSDFNEASHSGRTESFSGCRSTV